MGALSLIKAKCRGVNIKVLMSCSCVGMVQVNSQWVAAPSGATAGAGAAEARAAHAGFGQPQRAGGSFVIDNWNEG